VLVRKRLLCDCSGIRRVFSLPGVVSPPLGLFPRRLIGRRGFFWSVSHG